MPFLATLKADVVSATLRRNVLRDPRNSNFKTSSCFVANNKLVAGDFLTFFGEVLLKFGNVVDRLVPVVELLAVCVLQPLIVAAATPVPISCLCRFMLPASPLDDSP